MKQVILERYAETYDHKLVIAITTDKAEDLYNDFDKHTPYQRKDLDQDFADYLIDSASDLRNHEFIIQFHFASLASYELQSRIRTSIHSYFQYLIGLEKRELSRMHRTSFILFSIGFLILFISAWVNQKVIAYESVIIHVLAEGLVVAAWVSLWNAIANFLINWPPHKRQIKLYERICKADILF